MENKNQKIGNDEEKTSQETEIVYPFESEESMKSKLEKITEEFNKTIVNKNRREELKRANKMLLESVSWLKDLGLSDIQIIQRTLYSLKEDEDGN